MTLTYLPSVVTRLSIQVYGEKTAVKGMSMSMRAGEITALLGHNGAGSQPTPALETPIHSFYPIKATILRFPGTPESPSCGPNNSFTKKSLHILVGVKVARQK